MVPDTYVLRLNVFKSPLWKLWVDAVNKSGGIYKYRWGDNEIISLFGMMHQNNGIENFGLVEDKYHDQGMFRHCQSYAPSIKDLKK